MARLRTFLALDIGKTIRDRLITLQETLGRAAADVKWVEPENLHVTLLFLGEVDDRELPAICRAAQEAVADLPAFPLSIEGAGCFPNPRRPRVLWVGVGQGLQEVVAIHDAMEGKLLELGCYRREERKFTPHITLGRVKQDDSGEDLSMALQRKADWEGGSIDVREVLVMSSELTSQGPIYTVLSRAPLKSGR